MSDPEAEESHLVTPLPLTRVYHWPALGPVCAGTGLAPGCGRAGGRVQARGRAELSARAVAAVGLSLGLGFAELMSG